MKLFAIRASGNYGAGCAIVRADTKEKAIEVASKISGSSIWNIRWDKPDEVEELPTPYSGLLYLFETGE